MVHIPDRVHLLMTRGKASCDGAGIAKIIIDLPGDRYIEGGKGWFEQSHADDFILVYIRDKSSQVNLSSFQDEEQADASNKGWYMQPHAGGYSYLDIGAIVGGMDAVEAAAPSGDMELVITATTGDSRTTDTLRANIVWGVRT